MLYSKEVLCTALVNERRAKWVPGSSKSEPQTYLDELEKMTIRELEETIDKDQEVSIVQFVETWA